MEENGPIPLTCHLSACLSSCSPAHIPASKSLRICLRRPHPYLTVFLFLFNFLSQIVAFLPLYRYTIARIVLGLPVCVPCCSKGCDTLSLAIAWGDLHLRISEKGLQNTPGMNCMSFWDRADRRKAVKGESFTHPVCDRFLTLTRRWQGFHGKCTLLIMTLHVLYWGGFTGWFKIRTLDHIPSLKTAKQRHLNKVQILEADCPSFTQGSWDCDPPYTVPRARRLCKEVRCTNAQTPPLQIHSNVIRNEGKPSGVWFKGSSTSIT